MKIKKITRVITICVSLVVLIFGCFVIYKCIENKKINDFEPEPHREYVSNLTEEQHLQNLIKITEEIFAEEIANEEIVNYKVELVYAFYDNDPEYFLVELEFANEFYGNMDVCHNCDASMQKSQYVSKYRHLIGYHNNDKYYYGLDEYEGSGRVAFQPGQSPYTYLGFINEKKYYGNNVFGVEKNGEVLCVYSSTTSSTPVGNGCAHAENFTQYVPTEEQQYEYMSKNYKNDPYIYNKEYMSGKFREDIKR